MMSAEILRYCTIIVVRELSQLTFRDAHTIRCRAVIREQIVDVKYIYIADLMHRISILRLQPRLIAVMLLKNNT